MNSSTTNTNKSSRELKDQIMNDIQRVKDDFAEIKRRMTPGQIIDDAIFYRRGDSSPQMTFDHLKRNPVGTTFLTLGTLLLMEDETHVSYEGMVRTRAGEYKNKVSDAVSSARTKIDSVQGTIKSKLPHRSSSSSDDMGLNGTGYETTRINLDGSDSFEATSGSSSTLSSAKEGLDEARIKVGSATDSAKSKISSAAQSAKSTISSATGSVKSKTSAGIDSARSTLSSAAETIRARSQDAVHTAKNLDPLTYLALGAGLGTLTGAAFPISETEVSKVDQVFEDKMVEFRQELEQAFNKSANILKNEFIGGFTDINMSLF